MDTHRLRALIDLLLDEHRRLDIDHKFARILQTLETCTNTPSGASDDQFRAALTALLTALRSSRAIDLVESDRRILVEIDGGRVTGEGLVHRVLEVANERPFLAGRARGLYAELASELRRRMEALGSVQAGLADMNVAPAQLEPGCFELGILLPLDLVNGDVKRLHEELMAWDGFVKEFFPAVSTKVAPVLLRTYATSRFELTVPLDRDGALAVGTIVAGIYEMFRKVKDNRARAADLAKRGYPSDLVRRITAWEQQIVADGMRAIRESVDKKLSKRDDGRRRRDTDRILDRGLRFLAMRIREGVEVELVGPRPVDGVPESGRETVTHHVRAALSAARAGRFEPAPAPDKEAERQAPRVPLSTITEAETGTEGQQRAA